MSKKLAKEILKDIYPLNSDDEFIVEVMLEFGKRVCELQKQECARNIIKEAKENYGTSIPDAWDESSILNSKNVCE